MLKNLNKKDFFFNTINFAINIFITFILKIFILKLVMTSHKIVISFLKLNKLKTFLRQRSNSLNKSFLNLVKSNSPLLNQLFNFSNNMLLSEFSINKQRLSISKLLRFNQIYNIEQSKNPCFYQFSQFFIIKLRAFIKS